MSSQRRKSVRRRALLPAKVLLPAGTVECLVNDLSDEGAKLQFRMSPGAWPAQFRIMIAGEVTPRLCKLRWSTGLHIGIEFSGGRNALLNPAALEARLVQLRTGQGAQ
ncbi:hypothetical protein GCM10007036_27520 [Alsobacter metallidurans]|uniref:PilZ domain-containing protein n=1 Tax=Alsobacter metallidurans TaxID=340221 RepID=A0A917MK87_9HYPH|nr:PilZ domain-containing protein [Alsobacter metallidurans]GGH22481.1 hypothetical protein GCM10007036_27520 [Alsobacter metallidurans]